MPTVSRGGSGRRHLRSQALRVIVAVAPLRALRPTRPLPPPLFAYILVPLLCAGVVTPRAAAPASPCVLRPAPICHADDCFLGFQSLSCRQAVFVPQRTVGAFRFQVLAKFCAHAHVLLTREALAMPHVAPVSACVAGRTAVLRTCVAECEGVMEGSLPAEVTRIDVAAPAQANFHCTMPDS